MKIIYTIGLLFVAFLNYAQTYTYQEVVPYPFEVLGKGNAIEGDIDNDNDIDIITIGRQLNSNTGQIDTISIIYLNDGNANFQKLSSCKGLMVPNSALGDIDGDNDLDLIILGRNSNTLGDSPSETMLFKFDGTNYILQPLTGLANLSSAQAKFFDIDGDNDLDLLIMGVDDAGTVQTKLYTNDGTGNFTEVIGTNIMNVSNGSISISDVDGDNDLDFVLVGIDQSNFYRANTYYNDGNGNFTTTQPDYLNYLPFWADYSSSTNQIKTHFFNADGNSNVDLLISIKDSVFLMEYDGTGNFNLNQSGISEIKIPQSNPISTYIEDFDNDGSLDVLLHYQVTVNNNAYYKWALFINDGNGIFSKDENFILPYQGSNSTKLIPFDADNDGDIDLFKYASTLILLSTEQLLLYKQCNTTYSSITETSCINYVSPSGKTFITSGIYNDTIYNSKWCDSVITIDLTIKEVDVSISVINDTTLIANQDNANYNWGLCNGNTVNSNFITGQTYTPQFLIEGVYGVIVTYNGCTDTSDCINYYLGIDKYEENELQFYPNPTNDFVYLENVFTGSIEINIFDISGKQLAKLNTTNEQIKIDLSTFENGIYFIQVSDNDRVFKTIKVIKE